MCPLGRRRPGTAHSVKSLYQEVWTYNYYSAKSMPRQEVLVPQWAEGPGHEAGGSSAAVFDRNSTRGCARLRAERQLCPVSSLAGYPGTGHAVREVGAKSEPPSEEGQESHHGLLAGF